MFIMLPNGELVDLSNFATSCDELSLTLELLLLVVTGLTLVTVLLSMFSILYDNPLSILVIDASPLALPGDVSLSFILFFDRLSVSLVKLLIRGVFTLDRSLSLDSLSAGCCSSVELTILDILSGCADGD